MTDIKEHFHRDQRFIVKISGILFSAQYASFTTQYKYLKHSTGYFKLALDRLIIKGNDYVYESFSGVSVEIRVIDKSYREEGNDLPPAELPEELFHDKQRFLFTILDSKILLQYKFLRYSKGTVLDAMKSFIHHREESPITEKNGVYNCILVTIKMVTSDEFNAMLPLDDENWVGYNLILGTTVYGSSIINVIEYIKSHYGKLSSGWNFTTL